MLAKQTGDLNRTLTRMGRDRLGLWQIHDVRDTNDIRMLEEPGGALEAFYQARETGTVRGIGVTGHHDPSVLLHAVTHWDIDSVSCRSIPLKRSSADSLTGLYRLLGRGGLV